MHMVFMYICIQTINIYNMLKCNIGAGKCAGTHSVYTYIHTYMYVHVMVEEAVVIECDGHTHTCTCNKHSRMASYI